MYAAATIPRLFKTGDNGTRSSCSVADLETHDIPEQHTSKAISGAAEFPHDQQLQESSSASRSVSGTQTIPDDAALEGAADSHLSDSQQTVSGNTERELATYTTLGARHR